VREFRDDAGVEWVVFLTARSVARDQHLPEEYREGWLTFESAHGEKRRFAPVPKDWESLTDQELSVLCAQATAPAQRRKGASSSEAEFEELVSADAQPAESLEPQLRELETRLSSALGEVCELPPTAKLNTGELIRVEETLALATEAAKEAVSLRRKLRSDRNHGVRNAPDFRPRPDDRHA
jgi:hypothetical protein